VRPLLSFIVALAWCVTALQLTGCGNTAELEQSVAEKSSAIDKLEAEKKEMEAENGRLRAKIGELEKSLTTANGRAAELQRQIDELKARLEQTKTHLESSGMEGAYRDALRNFMDRRYEDAVEGFEALLAAGIPAPLNDNCHYWIGESYFGLKRYTEALASFDEVLDFEWSNKKDDSQVMIARCYARMGEMARARQEYLKLIEVYPASPYLELARRRSGTM
jgi:TolA-binding protein